MDKFPERHKLTRSHKKQVTLKTIFLFFLKMTKWPLVSFWDSMISDSGYIGHNIRKIAATFVSFTMPPFKSALVSSREMCWPNEASQSHLHVPVERILLYVPCKLLQNIESNSLLYIVGPCCLSILYTVVCTLIPNS